MSQKIFAALASFFEFKAVVLLVPITFCTTLKELAF
jgi:hypothetical protein